jgi:hypothetical protein
MKKKLPRLRSDREAEKFVATADLTEYDLTGLRTVRFGFQPKSERLKAHHDEIEAKLRQARESTARGEAKNLEPLSVLLRQAHRRIKVVR